MSIIITKKEDKMKYLIIVIILLFTIWMKSKNKIQVDKSGILRRYCKDRRIKCINLPIVISDPDDFKGIPTIEQEKL